MSTIPKEERKLLQKKLDSSMEMYKEELNVTDKSLHSHVSAEEIL